MTNPYPVLRYPSNVTGSEQAQSGAMLGWDEVGRPYEVLDAEFIEHSSCPCLCHEGLGDVEHRGEKCGCRSPYTSVFLQYATAETIRAALVGAGAGADTLAAASRIFQ